LIFFFNSVWILWKTVYQYWQIWAVLIFSRSLNIDAAWAFWWFHPCFIMGKVFVLPVETLYSWYAYHAGPCKLSYEPRHHLSYRLFRFISEIEAVCRLWMADGPKNLLVSLHDFQASLIHHPLTVFLSLISKECTDDTCSIICNEFVFNNDFYLFFNSVSAINLVHWLSSPLHPFL